MIPPLLHTGFLPPGRHECTVSEFSSRFVDAFPGTNRNRLFAEWLTYYERLQTVLQTTDLVQWIDGSFVSDKPNPGDIDVVTFVPYSIYESVEENLIQFYSTVNLYERGLDAYICPVYPVHHERHGLYKKFCEDWQQLFESHRKLADKKGFLLLTLSYGR